MSFRETILCATAPSSSTAGPGSIALHDIQTGSSLASFKQTSANAHCTAFVDSRNGQGGFMLSAQADKSILNVYNFQKDQIALKIVLPEKLSCIAVDRRGEFCAGGTAQGRIYLWEIASGILYNSWDAHYRQVSVLRFTPDGAALLSGSEDSGVSVWSVSRLLDDDVQNDLPAPYCTLSDHTLPITDIACGVGVFPNCRALTASVDNSAQLWDLSSRTLLTTFQFPKPISCLAWDVTERMFFAAATDGSIHQVNQFRQREDKLGGHVTEAVGGAGAAEVVRIDDDPEIKKKRLITVSQPITSISISLTSTLLVVGTETGLIHVYDVASHQLLRTISSHKGLSVTMLATLIAPADLVGHVNLDLHVGGSTDAVPVRPVASFQRMRDLKTREAHEVAILLPVRDKPSHHLDDSYPVEELIRDHSFFIQPEASSTTSASLQPRVSELEAEVARLREQLGKAKGVNDAMWENVVQKVISSGKEKKDKVVDDDSERRRKRGRT
ncbi:hypothetical protein PLICRDRAFT_42847 [Plicaturopsis crispa FD-325 SS-3]|nr:hypothetical protein PLICRDRAFT_42847 [Plicaturopsis crispa FD-325 SS-3]